MRRNKRGDREGSKKERVYLLHLLLFQSGSGSSCSSCSLRIIGGNVVFWFVIFRIKK